MTTFLGRVAELEALRDAVSRTRAGHAQTVLVEGEAGIGKTRLLTEAMGVAASRDVHTMRAAAHELERGRAYGPLLELGLVSDRASPDFEERLLGSIEERALERPVALCIEDLHWADAATVACFASCMRRLAHLPVLMLGSYRPAPRNEPLDALLGRLSDDAVVLSLDPLSEGDVASLIEELLGARPGPRLRAVVGGAAGNPLYVRELVAAMRADGVLVVGEGVAEAVDDVLPASLRITILRRLGFLTAQSLDVLRIAAVLGTFHATELAAVMGLDATGLAPVIAEGVRAGVLVEAGDALGFRHDLIRDALYLDSPLSLRRALHLDCARALARSGARPERAAAHFVAGADRGDAEAVECVRRAAAETVTRAPAVALELYAQTLALLPDGDPVRRALIVDMLYPLQQAGRTDDIQRLASEALDGGRWSEPLDPEREGALVYLYAWSFGETGRLGEEFAVAEEFLARPGVDDRAALQVVTQLASREAMAGRASAIPRAHEAIALAGRLGARWALVPAYDALSLAHRQLGRAADAIRFATEAMRTADAGTQWPTQRWAPRLYLARALVDADRTAEARDVVREGLAIADEHGLRGAMGFLMHLGGYVDYVEGAWDDAIANWESALALLAGHGSQWQYMHFQLATLHTRRGSLRDAAQWLDRAEAGLDMVDVRWARALWCEASADPAGALMVRRDVWHRTDLLPAVTDPMPAMVDLVRLAVLLDDRELAGEVTAATEDLAARRGTFTATGHALRARGLLDADGALLVRAVDAYRRGPRPLERALGCEDAGTALARGGRSTGAATCFREALGVYDSLGATWDATRCRAAARAAGVRTGGRARPARPTTGWGSLTPSERRVARLACDGLTNRAIGERLHISRHTVEAHLSHVFGKLHVRSRVELVALAGRLFGGDVPD